jgi:hypothetical protein
MGFFFEKDESVGHTQHHPNPPVNFILDQLNAKHANHTLQPGEFWTLIESPTDMGSCFLGEFIAASREKDICLVFEYLIRFGTTNKLKFFECMRCCLGIDGITPLNELILRMPATPTEYSKIIQVFYDLLDLIKTLDQKQKLALLNQEEVYRPCPVTTAGRLNKLYIINAIYDTISPSQAPQLAANQLILAPQ